MRSQKVKTSFPARTTRRLYTKKYRHNDKFTRASLHITYTQTHSRLKTGLFAWQPEKPEKETLFNSMKTVRVFK